HPPLGRQGRGAAGAGAVVAGTPPRAGNARSARLLARQLCGGALRPARPLSPSPLAGGPRQRAADPAGQAARDVSTALTLRSSFSSKWRPSRAPLVAVWRPVW